MSYLAPGSDPDIFVSYSHGDPKGGRAPLRMWTHALIRELQDHIRSLETEFKDLHLWMDPDFDPTAKLTEELRKLVSASGVLMIVMSKHYLKSDWCKDELGWFKEHIQSRRVAAGRVFIVKAQETDTNLWPDFLCDERGHAIQGFVFHDSEDGACPLSFGLKEPDAEYFKALNRLRIWLVKRLRELRDAKCSEPEKNATPSKPTREQRRIYLYARPNEDSERIDIARTLFQDGIVSLTAAGTGGRECLPNWLIEDDGRIRPSQDVRGAGATARRRRRSVSRRSPVHWHH